MAILGNRWDLDFINRRLFRDASVSPGVTDSTLALYSAVQDEMDEPDQMDDTSPMSAQTPTEFTMINGWFVDDVSVESLTGGALQSSGWLTNIRQIAFASTDEFVAADIGRTITGTASGDTGTILAFDNTRNIVWIRPSDDSGSTDSDLFNQTELFTVTGSTTQGQFTAASTTGETLWANPFTLGTFEDNTDIYVVQNGTKLNQFYPTGQIDILVKVKEVDVEIDDGVITVFAHQYSKLNDHFIIDLTSGGRQPVPLATADDLNNTTGYRTISWDGGSAATLLVDEIIGQGTDLDPVAIVLAQTGDAGAAGTFDYYLIDDLTDFSDGDNIEGVTSNKRLTIDGVGSDVGPGLCLSTDIGIRYTFTAIDRDLNNGNGSGPFSIEIDVASQPIQDMFECSKFVVRRGSVIDLNGLDGEQYLGNDRDLAYTEESTDQIPEGVVVTGGTSGAFGTVVANHTNNDGTGFLILRNTRGTFLAAELITEPGGKDATVSTERVIVPVKQSAFGTFAGGVFFGAPGVWLANVGAGDEQAFQLVDDDGDVQVPPNTVSVSITSLAVGDRVSVFRIDGNGDIIKTQLQVAAASSENQVGQRFIRATIAIPQDNPPAGVCRMVDATDSSEQRYRYSSFATAIFTLISGLEGVDTDGNSEATGGTTTTLIDAQASFVSSGVEIGDLVRNTADGFSTVVISVDSEQQLTTKAVAGLTWDAGDAYTINALDRTYVFDTDNPDFIYVPIIDRVADATSEANTVIHTTDISVVIRVRRGTVILPFQTTGLITAGGLTVAAIRTLDTIAV